MANKWFNEIFMQSLFDRAGTNKAMWLTVKQTAICVDNMIEHCSSDSDGITAFSWLWYTYEWQGRQVILHYSKKNGCGQIEFYLNAEEAEEQRKQNELEKAQREKERIARIKKNPERLAKKLASLNQELVNAKLYLQDELSEENPDQEEIDHFTEMVENLQAEIALYN